MLSAALLLVALSLFSINAGKPPRSSLAGRALLEVVGPVQSAVHWLGSKAEDIWTTYFSLVHAARHNKQLKAEVAELRGALVEQDEVRQANRRLRSLLALKSRMVHPVAAAEVVAVDPTNNFRTAIINRGTADGVDALMPVIQDDGAVGRVVWASPHYAKVLLLTDPNAGVDVLVQRTRARGVAEGAGKDRLRLKYVMQNDDVAVGDRLITSGAAGVFPKGILVGTVQAVKKDGKGVFQEVEVEPAVAFDRLEEVLVILRRPDFSKLTGKEGADRKHGGKGASPRRQAPAGNGRR